MLVITLPTFTAPTQLYKSRLRPIRAEVNQNPGYSESGLQIRAAGCRLRAARESPESGLQIRAAGCGRGAEGECSQNPGCKSRLRATGCGSDQTERRSLRIRATQNLRAANPGCGLREGEPREGDPQSESGLQIRTAGCGVVLRSGGGHPVGWRKRGVRGLR